MKRIVFAVLAGALSACDASHAALVWGLDAQTRMVDLTDEQWATVCAAIEREHAPPLTYQCDGRTMLADGAMCPAGDHCIAYAFTASFCMQYGLERTWRSMPSTCPVTVAEEAACVASIQACFEAYPMTPECVAASCPSATPDVAAADGGSS